MRRYVLTIGLLLVLGGVIVLDQGVQLLTPVAEAFGLVSRVQTERSLIGPTLLTVPASNYTFLSADLKGGVDVKGSVQVVDAREAALYVMKEGNLRLWRTGRPSMVILAKPVAISYNFTITPQTTGTYYFVFDNQDATRRTVIFNLSVLESAVRLNPLVGYAGYELLTLGFVFTIIGIKTGKKREPRLLVQKGLKCKFCGAELEGDQMFCEKCGRAQK